MRQWHVDPRFLCQLHLLGEHHEHHMFLGSLSKGTSLEGYIQGGLVEVATLRSRHDELALEMERRGYRHNSPVFSAVDGLLYEAGAVDREEAKAELARRCRHCQRRIGGRDD